jgi:hypothetical protein
MASDDDEITNELEGTEEIDEDVVDDDAAEVEPDADELVDEEDVFPDLDDDDDEATPADEEVEEEEDEADEAPTTRTKRRAGEEEEDEDEELLSPDDVEADLDRILKDRLVTTDDEDDEDDEDEPDDRGEPGDRLQPKRADEQLCPNCFLLVRATAPGCPVGDDACPIFG